MRRRFGFAFLVDPSSSSPPPPVLALEWRQYSTHFDLVAARHGIVWVDAWQSFYLMMMVVVVVVADVLLVTVPGTSSHPLLVRLLVVAVVEEEEEAFFFLFREAYTRVADHRRPPCLSRPDGVAAEEYLREIVGLANCHYS